jgi:hypothetical protein
MRSVSKGHRTPLRFATKLLMVLGLSAGTLLAAAAPASAEGQCFYVYQNGVGTTVCTP